jgi:formylglycine-generating enzyme required for sulfatase activity
LDDFYIDQYEVTNARYAECVDVSVCEPPSSNKSYTRDRYYDNAAYADYPVIYISWIDAKTYCEWREARLPTEAEWEKAARGGLEGAKYPWGNETINCSLANILGTACVGDTNAVGSYDPNGYGLYDVTGNVWEWTSDWYDPEYYANSPTKDPKGPENGSLRVLRGVSWGKGTYFLRVSVRAADLPDTPGGDSGIRCARTP